MSLYDPHHESFVRFCKAKAHGVMDVKDLINESIAAVFQNLDKIKSEKAFLSYMYSTASNLIKNEIRRKNIIYYENDFTEKYQNLHEESVSDKLDVSILYNALSLLPQNQKDAIILFEISGYKIKEIAALHKTSEANIKQRLSRGRKKLSELLNADELANETINRKSMVLLHLFF